MLGADTSPDGADITKIHKGIAEPIVAFGGVVKLHNGGLFKSTGNPNDTPSKQRKVGSRSRVVVQFIFLEENKRIRDEFQVFDTIGKSLLLDTNHS